MHNIKEQIHDIIYNYCTENKLYSRLFGYTGYEKLTDLNISFTINQEQLIKNDIKLFLDNIIAKIIYSNFDITEMVETKPFGNVILNNEEYENVFLYHSLEINDDNFRFCDIENYLDNIVIETNNNIIYITWKLPIYDLRK